MGILDLPAPIFQALDALIAFMPPTLRLILWSALGGALSMLLYALLSPQVKIADAKAALTKTRRLLVDADDSFDELMGLVKSSLVLSFKHLGLVLGPALLSAFPLICIMAWASNHFGYEEPQAGQMIATTTQPESAQITVSMGNGGGPQMTTSGENAFSIPWPGSAQKVVIQDAQGAEILMLPMDSPIPVVHKRQWWNSLLGNPAGYLPDNTPVELLHFALQPKQYLPIGPAWLRDWLALFLIASVLAALTTKRLFRIH